MNAFQVVFGDFMMLSILLLVGFLIRKNIKWVQKLYLPAALIGGFIGLLLGPQVLGQYTSFCLPIGANVSKWSGILITLVFSVQFLGSDPVDFNEAALSGYCLAGIGHMAQAVAGLLCAYFFMQAYPQLPLAFGITPVWGFYGGHGTAIAGGNVLVEMGWADGLAVANTMATAGLLSGIVVGMIIINIGVRKGYAKIAQKPEDMPREVLEGYVPVDKRKPIGMAVTGNDVIDPLVYHLCLGGLICFGAYKVAAWLKVLRVPAFAWGLVLGYVVWEVFKKLKIQDYVDRGSVSRVSGIAMEYLICSAIATMNIGIFKNYLVPIVVTILVVIIVNVFVYCYFGSRLFKNDWFERSVGAFGQASGVLATGLMLVRVVDPDLKTSAAGCIAAASVIGYTVSMPFLALSPSLVSSMAPLTFIGANVAILLVFIVAGRIFFWRKNK